MKSRPFCPNINQGIVCCLASVRYPEYQRLSSSLLNACSPTFPPSRNLQKKVLRIIFSSKIYKARLTTIISCYRLLDLHLTESEIILLRWRVVTRKHQTVGQSKVFDTQTGKCQPILEENKRVELQSYHCSFS